MVGVLWCASAAEDTSATRLKTRDGKMLEHRVQAIARRQRGAPGAPDAPPPPRGVSLRFVRNPPASDRQRASSLRSHFFLPRARQSMLINAINIDQRSFDG